MISISVKPAAPQIKKFYYLQARLYSICFLASFTLWSAQLKTSMRSAQNLCQIPVQVTRKHTLAPSPAGDYSTQEIPIHLLRGSRVKAAGSQCPCHSHCTVSCKTRKGKVHRPQHQFSSAQAFSQEGILRGGRCRRKQGEGGKEEAASALI